MNIAKRDELQHSLMERIDKEVASFARALMFAIDVDRADASVIIMGAIDDVYAKAKRNKYTNWKAKQ